jgi:hypothetical protein
MAKSQESGSESEWNIYIVHEPNRFGGPFGVFVDDCDENVYERIAKPINIFMEIRGKGLIAHKLDTAMKTYLVKNTVSWFDIGIEDLLSSLGEVLSDDFEREKSVHYASMMAVE